MLFRCHATHFYVSFGTQNLMVTIIFKFDPRKGELPVKLGQIRLNFKIQNLQKYAYLVQICLRIPTMSFIFIYDNKCQKVHFKNVTSSPSPGLLAIAQPKTMILLLHFVCMLFVCISITYNPFFYNLKTSAFGNYFLNNRNFEF